MPVVTHESWHNMNTRYASSADGAAKPTVASNSAAGIGINSIGGLLGAGDRQWQWLKGSSGRKIQIPMCDINTTQEHFRLVDACILLAICVVNSPHTSL